MEPEIESLIKQLRERLAALDSAAERAEALHALDELAAALAPELVERLEDGLRDIRARRRPGRLAGELQMSQDFDKNEMRAWFEPTAKHGGVQQGLGILDKLDDLVAGGTLENLNVGGFMPSRCDYCGREVGEYAVLTADWRQSKQHGGERYQLHICEGCFFGRVASEIEHGPLGPGDV